jgi:methylmalonyl-CoA/ethylmalonyl-CoA epimerase
MGKLASDETGTCDMVIDHIGIVVKSLDQGMAMWEKTFGYARMTQPVINTRQRVRVVFLQKEGSLPVKLVEPADPGSPVFAIATRGGGFHHVCFRTDDMEKTLQRIERDGGRVIVPPEPGEAFENEPIAFVYMHGLPTEIIATDKKAMRLAVAENRK